MVMTKNIKVKDVAKDLNISFNAVVAFLNKKGYKQVKNLISSVDDDMMRDINIHFKKAIDSAERHQRKIAEIKETRRRAIELKLNAEEVKEKQIKTEILTNSKDIKVKDVARGLNISFSDTVAFLNKKGYKQVKNLMSSVDDDMMKDMNAHFKKEKESAERNQREIAEMKETGGRTIEAKSKEEKIVKKQIEDAAEEKIISSKNQLNTDIFVSYKLKLESLCESGKNLESIFKYANSDPHTALNWVRKLFEREITNAYKKTNKNIENKKLVDMIRVLLDNKMTKCWADTVRIICNLTTHDDSEDLEITHEDLRVTLEVLIICLTNLKLSVK